MIDPICGMNVEPNNSAGSHVHSGQIYYFCSQHCVVKFKEDPEILKSAPTGQAAHGHGQSHADTAMAGDGVNDAPALALAHVGIAMGTGTDVANGERRSDVGQGRPARHRQGAPLESWDHAQHTAESFLCVLYNVLGIPIAAGVLYPIFGMLLSPVIASVAMTFSSQLAGFRIFPVTRPCFLLMRCRTLVRTNHPSGSRQ